MHTVQYNYNVYVHVYAQYNRTTKTLKYQQ